MSTVEDLAGTARVARHLVVVPDAGAASTPDAALGAPEARPQDAAPAGAVLGDAPAAAPDPGVRPAFPVEEALWRDLVAIAPDVGRRPRRTGRRRRDDRAVLEGILHVLATGVAWRELPQELACGSGVTCWRRLREWADAGTWGAIEPRLRLAVPRGVHVDWSRAWAGVASSRPSLSAPRPTHDPGATPVAVERRLAWAGPSLI